ncbi:MAG: hypothetical protein JRC86_06820 [Deltaproteobacteria bacterium]|nr:hypothetical protein [Deltaproteobacteria bacterium]
MLDQKTRQILKDSFISYPEGNERLNVVDGLFFIGRAILALAKTIENKAFTEKDIDILAELD